MTLEDFRIDDDDLFANTGGTFDDEDIVAETPRFYPEPCFCAQYGAHLCNRHSSLLSSQVATPIVLPDQVVAHPSATANVPVQSPASVGSGRAEQHQPMWNERPGPLFVHSLPSSPSYTWQEPADAWSSAEYAQSLSVQSALPRVQSQSPGPSVSPYLHHTEQHSVFMGYNPIQAYGRPISSQGFVGGTSQMAISLPDQTYAHPWLPLHRTSMPSTYDIPRSSYQSERHPNPRDVSRLVDDLQRSSHRESTASPNDNSTGYPTPPSTGSPSTVSSSKRRSNAKMKEHDPAYPHVCESCGKRFANLGDLGKHDRYHGELENRPYKCDHCSWRFNFPRELARHETKHRKPEDIDRFYCDVFGCDRYLEGFPRKDNRDRHERRLHGFDRFSQGSPSVT